MKKTILQFLTLVFLLLSTIINAQDSTYTKLWENGKKMEEGVFQNGKKEGIWNKWNQKGELIEFEDYLLGVLTTRTNNDYYSHTNNLLYEKKIYGSSKILIEERAYKYQDNNIYNVIYYNEKGIIQSSGKLNSDKKEGKWNFYKEDGTLLEVKKIENKKKIVYGKNRLKKYTKGFYISHNVDTIYGYFKDFSLSEKCNKIKFIKDTDTKAIIMYPEEILGYKIGNDYFISKNIGNSEFSNFKYVKSIVAGQLSLYEKYDQVNSSGGFNPATGASQFGSSYEKTTSFFELNGKELHKVKKTNFRKRISAYLSDNKELSLKILNKKLTINDLVAITNEYNEWHKNGAKNYINSSSENEIDAILNDISDTKLAIEIPLSFSKNFIIISNQGNADINTKEKTSYDVGLGMRFFLTEEFKLRLGVHYWNIPINPSYQAIAVDNNNNEIIINVSEESSLKNVGIYLAIHYEGEHAFFGGGINIGLSNNYKTKLSYYDESNNLLFSESSSKSILAEKFKNQSHLEVIGGLKFNTKTNFSLKPFLKMSIPVQPIFDPNHPRNTEFSMHAFAFNLGLILDIGFINK